MYFTIVYKLLYLNLQPNWIWNLEESDEKTAMKHIFCEFPKLAPNLFNFGRKKYLWLIKLMFYNQII